MYSLIIVMILIIEFKSQEECHMDKKALYNLSYGVFMLATRSGNVVNGCITNTCIQVANNPVRIAISVLNSNYTCDLIKESGIFTLSLLDQTCSFETIRHFGFQSGRDVDKFAKTGLTPIPMEHVHAMGIDESPVNMECKITEKRELGSHTMFIAEVVGVTVDDQYMDETGKFHINESGLVMYSHGEYFALGKKLGKFGYSVKKK